MSSHAELCPVCSGSGKYKDGTCHGCKGLGWVTAQDLQSFPLLYPVIIYPQYPVYPAPIYPQREPSITYYGTTTKLGEETT
jgi:hypothetical protein